MCFTRPVGSYNTRTGWWSSLLIRNRLIQSQELILCQHTHLFILLKALTTCFLLGKIPCHPMPANGLWCHHTAWKSSGSVGSIGAKAAAPKWRVWGDSSEGCLCLCSLPGPGVPQSSSDSPKGQPIISQIGHWMSVSCHRNETYFLRMKPDFSGCRGFRLLFKLIQPFIFYLFFPTLLIS